MSEYNVVYFAWTKQNNMRVSIDVTLNLCDVAVRKS